MYANTTEVSARDKEIWVKNFVNTLSFIEAKLGIHKNSPKQKDRDLHYILKGALYEMGRNLTSDLVEDFKNRG